MTVIKMLCDEKNVTQGALYDAAVSSSGLATIVNDVGENSYFYVGKDAEVVETAAASVINRALCCDTKKMIYLKQEVWSERPFASITWATRNEIEAGAVEIQLPRPSFMTEEGEVELLFHALCKETSIPYVVYKKKHDHTLYCMHHNIFYKTGALNPKPNEIGGKTK